jgi:hypothetical protein
MFVLLAPSATGLVLCKFRHELKRMFKNLHLGAMASFLGFAACGLVGFKLERSLESQGRELSKAREQLLALDQSLAHQQHDLGGAREAIIAAVSDKFAEAQTNYQALNRQLTNIQSKLHDMQTASETHGPFPQVFDGPAIHNVFVPAAGPDVAVADSVEGKLKAEGKHWKRTQGPVLVGSYAEDTLKARANQPKGRGWIGKVLSIGPDGSALVDFGRGYMVGIGQNELSPVDFEEEMR